MNAQEQIQKCKDFLEKLYLPELLDAAAKGQNYIQIDLGKLSIFHPDLTSYALEEPEEIIGAFRHALESFDMTTAEDEEINADRFNIRFYNLPQKEKAMIRHLRSKHLNKLLFIEGTVRQKSDVRPKTTSAEFECPSCGNNLTISQKEEKLRQPHQCPKCKFKGKFRLLKKELIDAQGIVLEEISSHLDGGEQPKRLKIYLEEDLVSQFADKKTNPGTNIRVTGILKEVEKVGRDGAKLTASDFIFHANHVASLSEDFNDIKITPEQEKELKELAADPNILKNLVKSSAPGIYGHDMVKEAILMQFAGGVQKHRSDGVKNRGDLHMLLIGDPGSGKCITGDSLILQKNGNIKPIQDIVETKSVEELPSIGLNGQSCSQQITKFWKRKTNTQLLKITTQSGKQISVTNQHPLFFNSHGFTVSKEASQFKIGEHIAIPRKITIEGKLQSIPKKIAKKYSQNSKLYSFPRQVDSSIALLIGLLAGDGCLRKTQTSAQISLTNIDIQTIDSFKTIFKTYFNANCSQITHNNAIECSIYSKDIYSFFEDVFSQIVQKSDFKTIPDLILKSPNVVLASFIRGLFECDAHVNTKKNQIEYCTISKDLAKKIQISLTRFGIVSYLKTKVKFASNTIAKRKIVAYELIIPRFCIEKFIDIGFITDIKNNALYSILSKPKNTNVDLIPNMGDALYLLRRDLERSQKEMGVFRSTYAHYEQKNRLISRVKLQEIVTYLDKYEHPLLDVLKEQAYSDLYWDKIMNIEKIDHYDYVYDFEVTQSHNFIANGVMVHNSQLLKRASVFAPKSRYVSGKGASGAGLTASVVKDDFMGGWALEAGALVLANRGICCIDELDKMTDEDRSAMHEALEQQSVTISKANIQASLMCETTVLAAANPKMGRFDPFENIAKQINLPPALINRFDLIFPFRDIPDVEGDDRLASFILKMHHKRDTEEPLIDTDTLRRYLVYIRKTCFPEMTESAREEIKNYYVRMRNSGSNEGGMAAISLSARQLEALIRMTEASAKLRISQKATKRDAKKAIELLDYCLSQIGIDPETGKVDIDRIQTGFTTSDRKKAIGIREIIKELEESTGQKMIPMDDIVDLASQKGMDDDKVQEAIEKLKLNGDIYEPKRGFISRIV